MGITELRFDFLSRALPVKIWLHKLFKIQQDFFHLFRITVFIYLFIYRKSSWNHLGSFIIIYNLEQSVYYITLLTVLLKNRRENSYRLSSEELGEKKCPNLSFHPKQTSLICLYKINALGVCLHSAHAVSEISLIWSQFVVITS